MRTDPARPISALLLWSCVTAVGWSCSTQPTEYRVVPGATGGTIDPGGTGGETAAQATGGESAMGGLGGAMDGFVSESLEAVDLSNGTANQATGSVVDLRTPIKGGEQAPNFQGCEYISRITKSRQRTVVGPGTQLSVGLVGPDGRALSGQAYSHCLSIDSPNSSVIAQEGAPTSNALTMLVVQPAENEEQNQEIIDAVSAFFLSRPRGERVALYRWGVALRQVSDFTNFYGSFRASAENGLLPLSEEPLGITDLVTASEEIIENVVDDGPAWSRSVVVIAPSLSPNELSPPAANSQFVWAINGSASAPLLTVDAGDGNLLSSLERASALTDERRRKGVVTFGLCTNGEESDAVVRSAESNAELAFALKDALPEEMIASCDPDSIRKFESYQSDVFEMRLSPEVTELHSELILPESRGAGMASATKEVDIPAEFSLTPQHAPSLGEAHLRGRSSLATCDPHRLSYAVNLESGRERFLIPESEAGVGTDKFTLVAMCLDPTYLNQVTANALMAEMELFSSAHKLIEFRINDESQGVYLLIENVTDSIRRRYAGVSSILRRGTPTEVKFPDEEEDAVAAELALEPFENVSSGWASLDGAARLKEAEQSIDLRRFLYYIAFNSLLENADWNDEPYFVGLDTLKEGVTVPSYRVYAWDNDDILKGGCDHEGSVAEDPFDLVGCAEGDLEQHLFGVGDGGSERMVDDEVYAFYVELLEQMLAYLTEERVEAAFTKTASQLKTFAADPGIVAAMPEWSDVEDVPAAIDAAVLERIAAFAARRAEITANLQVYLGSR